MLSLIFEGVFQVMSIKSILFSDVSLYQTLAMYVWVFLRIDLTMVMASKARTLVQGQNLSVGGQID
jgi:hypothetical protein